MLTLPPRNHTHAEAALQPIGDEAVDLPLRESSPFPMNPKLNRLLMLTHQADPLALGVDALVIPTNERLDDGSAFGSRVHRHAGAELSAECAQVAPCPLGQAILTRAFDLPARFLIHAVGPRFNDRFRMAAETALQGAYRSSLELLRAHRLRTVALPELHPSRKGYPAQSAAHLACRSLRRWLEAHPDALDRVVLVLTELENRDVYRRVLPLYFPRSPAEEALAAVWLPADVGELEVVKESVAGGSEQQEHKADDDDPASDGNDAMSPAEPAPRKTPIRLGSNFSQAQEDPDQQRQRASAAKSRKQLQEDENNRRYHAYLRQAKEADLAEVGRRNFIYQSGVDGLGRPIICLMAGHVPAESPKSLERALLYVIRLLDPIVAGGDWVLIYFNTQLPNQKRPPVSWLREVHGILSREYKKNLKRVVILHPTFWVKTTLAFARLFLSAKVWRKVVYAPKLLDLYREFDPRHLRIPAHVLQYDQDKFPASYASSTALALSHQ